MFTGLTTRLRLVGRKVALTGTGAVLALIGAGFLTGAVFLALAAAHGAILACVVVGGGYLGLGLIAIALGTGHHAATVPPVKAATPVVHTGADMAGPLATAFVVGIQNGIAAGARRTRH